MYEFLLALHFIGLALAVGTGFAFMALGIGTKDMPLPERGAFMLRAFVIGRNGTVGLTLLVLSGLGLVWVRGGFALVGIQGGIAFWVKMALVVILLALAGVMESLMKRAKRDRGGAAMAKIPKLGPVMLFTGLAIIVSAVLAFH